MKYLLWMLIIFGSYSVYQKFKPNSYPTVTSSFSKRIKSSGEPIQVERLRGQHLVHLVGTIKDDFCKAKKILKYNNITRLQCSNTYALALTPCTMESKKASDDSQFTSHAEFDGEVDKILNCIHRAIVDNR